MLSPNQETLTLTTEEIQVLTRSADALWVLINHYEHQEQLPQMGRSSSAALAARRELIESILDEASPKLEAKDLPRNLHSSEEHDTFDRAQARLFLSDPAQAIGNLRWMLCQVWWRWQSLDLSIRQLRSGPWKNRSSAQVQQPPSEQHTEAAQVRARILDFDRQLTSAGRTPTGLDYDTILGWAASNAEPTIRLQVLTHDHRMRSAGLRPTGDDYQAVFSIVTGLASSLNESISPTGP
jgi:hypothetical protein